MLDLSGVVCLVLERDGQLLEANERAANLLGTSRQALLGQPWTMLCPAGDAADPWSWAPASAPAPQAVACATRPRAPAAARTVTLRGEHGPVELTLHASELALERAPELLCLVGHPAAAARLRTSFFSDSPIPMQLSDRAGRLLEVNGPWQQLLGYAPHEVLGRTLESLLEAGSSEVPEVLEGLGRGEAVREAALRLRSQDGRQVEVLFSAARLGGDGDEVVGYLIDVSERRRAADELRRAREDAEAASRAKSAFLANMSHELRTPLNGILGYAQLLERQSGLSPEQRRGIDAIRRSGEHLLTLINDVLDLARIESNRQGLSREPFHLIEFLHEVAALVRTRAEQKGLSFVLDLAPQLAPRVHGDSRKLRQVLLNLLGNAVKFTEAGGVTLRVSPLPETGQASDAERLCFEIIDTGVGIPPEQLERVFQPFEQIGAVRIQISGQGTGLGLAIVRELATLMGTRVEVESAPGAGSRFWFGLRLPAAEPLTAAHAVPRARRIRVRDARPRVLVVDDQWENRSIVRSMLEPLGFEVDEASDGLEALAMLEQLRPAAVLLDLVMPSLHGSEVARRIRAREALCAVRIIALTARVMPEDRAQSAEAGCDAFVAKPIRMEELLDTLGAQLGLSWVTDDPEEPDEAERSSTRLASVSPAGAPRASKAGAGGAGEASRGQVLPAAELAALRGSANEGRIVEVRRELARLEALAETPAGQRYARFVRRLGRFVRQFQLEELVEFIDASLPPAAR